MSPILKRFKSTLDVRISEIKPYFETTGLPLIKKTVSNTD